MTDPDKQAMRDAVRAKVNALSASAIAEQSALVQARALALPVWRTVRTVACYMAMPREVCTDAILAHCRERGIRVCVPVRLPDGGDYAFGWLEDAAGMREGAWGIPEPRIPRWAADATNEAVVVPGVAFDRDGGRLGHGRGFYDRLLCGKNVCSAFRMGLAFDVQMVDNVPMGPRDVRMHAVAGPRETILTKGKELC